MAARENTLSRYAHCVVRINSRGTGLAGGGSCARADGSRRAEVSEDEPQAIGELALELRRGVTGQTRVGIFVVAEPQQRYCALALPCA